MTEHEPSYKPDDVEIISAAYSQLIDHLLTLPQNRRVLEKIQTGVHKTIEQEKSRGNQSNSPAALFKKE